MGSSESARRHLVSIGQAAEYAGLSTKTIRRRISDGSIRGYRAGPRAIRIDLGEIDRLLTPIPAGGGGDGA